MGFIVKSKVGDMEEKTRGGGGENQQYEEGGGEVCPGFIGREEFLSPIRI